MSTLQPLAAVKEAADEPKVVVMNPRIALIAEQKMTVQAERMARIVVKMKSWQDPKWGQKLGLRRRTPFPFTFSFPGEV